VCEQQRKAAGQELTKEGLSGILLMALIGGAARPGARGWPRPSTPNFLPVLVRVAALMSADSQRTCADVLATHDTYNVRQ
jgi:hypothetical protein